MAWLALVAVLLTVAAPTVSRVLAATVAKTAPVLMEMCTVAGLKVIDVSPYVGGGEAAPPMAAMGDACGYCVLATPPLLALVLLCLLALRPPQAPLRGLYRARQRSVRNARGLGSQGPPLAL